MNDHNESFSFPSNNNGENVTPIHKQKIEELNDLNHDETEITDTHESAQELELEDIQSDVDILENEASGVPVVSEHQDPIGSAGDSFLEDKEKKKQERDNHKAEKKSRKKTSPGRKNAQRVIKKIFVGGVLIIGLGTGFIWASQNGYITHFENVFSGDTELSKIDKDQNEIIAKLQLKLSDIDSQLADNRSYVNQHLDAQKQQQADARVAMRLSFEKYIDSKVVSQLDTLKQGLTQVKHNLSALSNHVGTNKAATNKNASYEKSNSTRLDVLQKQVQQLIDNVAKTKQESINAAKKMHLKSNQKVTSSINNSVPVAQNSSKAGDSVPTPIYSYSGLRLVRTFPWSTQQVAVLSDSLGMTTTVAEGTLLGDAVVTNVSSNRIVIHEQTTDRYFSLLKR